MVNLGTPDNPDAKSVKRYLKQFLSDPRVIDYPRWLWKIILNCIILPVRSPKVAKAYKSIWQEGGSPLRVISYAQAKGIAQMLKDEHGIAVAMEVAMTYGNPSMDEGIEKLLDKGVERIVVLPMYPQYSATTTAAVYDALSASLAKIRDIPEVRFIKHYAHEPRYLKVLAQSIAKHRAENGTEDHLLMFSFHGLPKRYVELGDPYKAECEMTANEVAKQLGLSEKQYMICYQSRVGKEEWLQPYTDETLESLPEKGIKKVNVVCPAFAADCLETYEEIAIENKEVFVEAGGESYQYIPALNDSPEHIEVLTALVAEQLNGW